MALYYNVKNVFIKFNHQENLVAEELEEFVQKMNHSLKKAEKHLLKKKYIKLEKHLLIIQPITEILEIHQANDQVCFLQQWIEKKGKIKEVIEIFKPFKKSIKLAIKEIKKDYQIAID